MIEIDHTIEHETQEPEPAKPILASRLLELEERQRTRFARNGKSETLKTGCAEIDELLGGKGVERGIVVGISAEGGEGRLISLHLLATILLSHLTSSATSAAARPETKATIIDTTGSYPLSLLANILKSRILEARATAAIRSVQTGNFPVSHQGRDREDTGEGIDADIQRCLEMVALSRVFDIEGLWEVLGEVGGDSLVSRDDQEQRPADTTNDGEEEVKKRKGNTDQSSEKSLEVVDSEEEITSVDDGSSPKPISALARGVEEGDEDEDGLEVIIVDNMTHIVNDLFARKEKGDAHTLLSLLSHTLHTLTQTNNILTILHNTTVPTKSTYPQPAAHRQSQPLQPTSLFPSSPMKPALGQIFTQFPSLHLLLSSLPKHRTDAAVLYGHNAVVDGDIVGGEGGRVQYCTVVEVLKDEAPNLGEEKDEREFGWREGMWCAVEVRKDGLALVGAFVEKGNMRGIDMERAHGKAPLSPAAGGGLGRSEVGNVAKTWGFGGRRA